MSPATATFFLSTGRCGTQSLTNMLASCLGTCAVVEHEPLGPAYHASRYFRNYKQPRVQLQERAIAAHLERISDILQQGRSYIETGWPCYAALPMFVSELPGRVRIVQLVRDPIRVALSMCTHGYFQDSPNPFNATCTLGPESLSAMEICEPAAWEKYSPYEKSLLHWAGIHSYGDELRQRFNLPFHVVRFEHLFGDHEDVGGLEDFLSLPFKQGLSSQLDKRVDEYSFRSYQWYDLETALKHKVIVDLSTRYGYDLRETVVSGEELVRRYRDSSLRSMKKYYRRKIVKKLKSLLSLSDE